MKPKLKLVPDSKVTAVSEDGRAFKVRVSTVNPHLFQVIEERPFHWHGKYKVVYAGSNYVGGRGALHVLLAKAFLGEKPEDCSLVRHKNDDPTDNRIENLAWGTDQDNADDREDNGRTARKLSKEDVCTIVELAKRGEGQTSIGNKLGLSKEHVHGVLSGRLASHWTGIKRRQSIERRRKYSEGFKAALAQYLLNGMTPTEVMRLMGVSPGVVYRVKARLGE